MNNFLVKGTASIEILASELAQILPEQLSLLRNSQTESNNIFDSSNLPDATSLNGTKESDGCGRPSRRVKKLSQVIEMLNLIKVVRITQDFEPKL